MHSAFEFAELDEKYDQLQALVGPDGEAPRGAHVCFREAADDGNGVEFGGVGNRCLT